MKAIPILIVSILLLAASSSVALVQAPAAEEDTAWVCPMHADFTMDSAGKCPRCGMALVRAAPFDVRDYGLDFRTVPAVVKPGQKTKIKGSILLADALSSVSTDLVTLKSATG